MEEPRDSRREGGFKWWPHHVMISVGVMALVVVMIVTLATLYPVPDDAPQEIPFPDDGENIPGPEWLFLLFWFPFWYCVGSLKKYLALMPLAAIFIGLFLIALPFLHKIPLAKIPGLGKLMAIARAKPPGHMRSFLYALPALFVALVMGIATYEHGHEAKVLGCDSCHNRAMGHRMAVPPEDVARYYNVERAMQIEVGKYRAGKSTGVDEQGQIYAGGGGEEGGYKNANWQMRHMYEPTFTW